MSKAPKQHIGTTTCHLCGGAVHLVQNEAGTVSYTCVPCDWSPYFKAHTDGKKRVMASATLKAPAPEPVATPPAAKPAAPAAKPGSKPAPAPTPAPAPQQKPKGIAGFTWP